MERTTVTFESGLLKKLRQLAASKSTTISHLLNEIVWAHLHKKPEGKGFRLHWRPFPSGIRPDVDIADRDVLFDIMDKDR